MINHPTEPKQENKKDLSLIKKREVKNQAKVSTIETKTDVSP